jgi:thymidylate kinase
MDSTEALKSTIVVSFSGIDGSGKSTQIRELCDCLRKNHQKFKVLTFWDDVASFKNMREVAGRQIFGGDAGVGTPQAPIRRRDKDVQTLFMTFVRIGIYLVDAGNLRRAFKNALQSGADVIIFDRYIYDQIVNLNLQNPLLRWYARQILKLAPAPHVALLLDADPAAARARKPEYPVEFLHANREAYLQLSRLVPGITVIPPLAQEQVRSRIAAYLASFAASGVLFTIPNCPPVVVENPGA